MSLQYIHYKFHTVAQTYRHVCMCAHTHTRRHTQMYSGSEHKLPPFWSRIGCRLFIFFTHTKEKIHKCTHTLASTHRHAQTSTHTHSPAHRHSSIEYKLNTELNTAHGTDAQAPRHTYNHNQTPYTKTLMHIPTYTLTHIHTAIHVLLR